MRKPRLVVVDDDSEFLRALVLILDAEFDIMATSSGGQEALDRIRQCKPDVVVLGLGKGTQSGFGVLAELAENHAQSPRVVICSPNAHAMMVTAARHAGALAYVFKDRIEEDLTAAVQSAQQLRFFASPGATGQHAAFFKELGRRLKALRQKAGYAQTGMAQFGFSVRHWQQIEAGRPISVTTLLRICEIFKTKPDELVGGLDENIF